MLKKTDSIQQYLQNVFVNNFVNFIQRFNWLRSHRYKKRYKLVPLCWRQFVPMYVCGWVKVIQRLHKSIMCCFCTNFPKNIVYVLKNRTCFILFPLKEILLLQMFMSDSLSNKYANVCSDTYHLHSALLLGIFFRYICWVLFPYSGIPSAHQSSITVSLHGYLFYRLWSYCCCCIWRKKDQPNYGKFIQTLNFVIAQTERNENVWRHKFYVTKKNHSLSVSTIKS